MSSLLIRVRSSTIVEAGEGVTRAIQFSRALGCACCAFLLALTGAAAAQTSGGAEQELCVAGHEKAQELRLTGKLIESKRALLTCTEEQCPSMVRADCVRWLEEVESAIPTVVIVAVADAGDEVDVSVTIDGTLVTRTLNGQPIELDPGVHEMKFERASSALQVSKVNLGQGEKNRIVRLDFRTKAPADSAAMRSPEPSASAPKSIMRPTPTLTYVLGGLALAATASTVYFGVGALHARSDAKSCEPLCRSEIVDEVRHKALYADISAIVALAAAAGSLVLYDTRPSVTAHAKPMSPLGVGQFNFGFSQAAVLATFGGAFQ